MANEGLKAIHDELLENKPEGASHDAATCPLCSLDEAEDHAHEGGVMDPKTYSQEEVDALIAESIRTYEAEIAELKGSMEASEVAASHAKEKEALEAKISELQGQLDAAVLETEAAKKQYEDLVTYLETEKTAQDEAAAMALRKEERLNQVREVAAFPQEYLDKNADRWAAMSDEDFAASVADWQTIGSKRDDTTPPRETAMVGARSEPVGDDDKALMREIIQGTARGIDPRSL